MTTATVGGSAPGSTPRTSLLARARVVGSDIKLAHSVFAMPFAVLGAVLARPAGEPAGVTCAKVALVVVCMVLARTWAMLVNRIADRGFDAANARTARRALASGRLGVRDARAFAFGCAVCFVFAAGLFWLFFANPWPMALSVPVLAWIAFYSFTKRFTALCHIFLGGALGASPLAAAIAMHPQALTGTPALWWLAGMVVLWVGGFDVIYALQDVEFDRRTGLHSIPARLGPERAIWVSRALHAAAAGCLVMAARSDQRFGVLFACGVGVVGVLLVTEHVVLARRGRAGLEMAFFTLNGIVSCVLGAAGVLDILAR
jgi:4-hydroxybenzoate polyprenyltransferase